MMNFLVDRLVKYADLKPAERASLRRFADFLKSCFDLACQIPRYLIPRYFDLIVTSLYVELLDRAFSLMQKSSLVSNGSWFVRSLALGGVSLCASLTECALPDTILEKGKQRVELSLSAGLPHFCASYMRNWGRDTFISLRGLLLLCGRFDEARDLILTFGSAMRHGLIPNLLGDGKFSRYNCRDAVWWWLKSIKGN